MKSYPVIFRNTILVPSLLFLLIALAGCGSTETTASLSAEGGNFSAAAAAAAPAMEAPAAESAPAAASESEGIAAQSPAMDGRKIVANAHLDLLVRDAQSLEATIGDLMTQTGGYISAANLQSKSDQISYREEGSEMYLGTITLRVPPAKIEASLSGLERLAMEVKSKTIDRQDVTDQYTDLDAQLRNLTATEDELRVLLTEVRQKPNSTPEQILTVHEKVTQIRSQIDQIQGRKNMLENLVSLSTINISIFQFIPPQPPQQQALKTEPIWQPWLVVGEAGKALILDLQELTDSAIWFTIYGLPILIIYLVPLAFVAWVVRWFWRRLRVSLPRVRTS